MNVEKDFQTKNNYKEVINDTGETVNTCQDCLFHTRTKFNKNNELYCTQGDFNVSVNGICKAFEPVI